MAIILSIKVEEMEKKLRLLLNQKDYPIFNMFDDCSEEDITY
jgi:hypothetical protein